MPDIRRIDLNLLVALDALLDERNVTRAAARLGYTQPTISGMLGRLRDLFGDPLFVRTQRGVLPTPRAQALALPLKQLLADGRRLVERETFDPASARTTFTVSTNDYMQHALLVPFVQALRREARNVRLAIAPPVVEGLSDALARERIDLAVTIPEFAAPDLRSRLLYRERYVVAVRPRHPLARRCAMSIETFCAFDHVLVSPRVDRSKGPPIERSPASDAAAPSATPFRASCCCPSCCSATISSRSFRRACCAGPSESSPCSNRRSRFPASM